MLFQAAMSMRSRTTPNVRLFAGPSPLPVGKRYDAIRATADLRQSAGIEDEDSVYANSARMR